MISENRIVEIFRTRGGGEEFIRPAEHLPSQQLAYVRTLAQGEPIIAKPSVRNEWLVLTKSHLVIECFPQVLRISLEDVESTEIPKHEFLNRNLKLHGGSLDIGIRGGSSLRVTVEPGGVYFGLLNVLMRFAARNQAIQKAAEAPTTDDNRPTTQL